MINRRVISTGDLTIDKCKSITTILFLLLLLFRYCDCDLLMDLYFRCSRDTSLFNIKLNEVYRRINTIPMK